jgi:hypothetical protein
MYVYFGYAFEKNVRLFDFFAINLASLGASLTHRRGHKVGMVRQLKGGCELVGLGVVVDRLHDCGIRVLFLVFATVIFFKNDC